MAGPYAFVPRPPPAPWGRSCGAFPLAKNLSSHPRVALVLASFLPAGALSGSVRRLARGGHRAGVCADSWTRHAPLSVSRPLTACAHAHSIVKLGTGDVVPADVRCVKVSVCLYVSIHVCGVCIHVCDDVVPADVCCVKVSVCLYVSIHLGLCMGVEV